MSLPAFILALANSNLMWLGCKRFTLPPVNSRWSVARSLGLVAVIAGLALVLACLISLLTAGQLLWWLLWMLGGFAACQGTVMVGLMMLCWNQRVVKLQTNPNLPLELPPVRFRLWRWALGLFYAGLLAVLTPLAMLVTVENMYGQMTWRREYARLVAQGERMTSRDLLGPAIPDEQNAGAAPVFAPFFAYPSGGWTTSPQDLTRREVVSNAMAQVSQRLVLPYAHLPEKPKKMKSAPKAKESMDDWSAAYRKMIMAPSKTDPSWASELKLPAPGNAARDVLVGLAVGDQVLAEICAASARPRAQFPVRYDAGFFQVFLEHLSLLKSAQINLNLRCAAHLAANEVEAAFVDATNALNVAELLREEPLMISQLVRCAQGALRSQTLWHGLVEHRWTDSQLAVFQERLSRVDYLTGMVRAIEGERACSIVGLDALITGKVPGEAHENNVTDLRRLTLLVPLGMLRQNQAAMAQYYTVLLEAMRTNLARASQTGLAVINKTGIARERNKLQRTPYSPFTILAKMLIPASANFETKTARMHTLNQMTITVCALERYRIANGNYPETLAQLVPAYLPKLLLDPMSNQAFHYRRTDDGWFHFYSVGDDGKDDGGVFRTQPKEAIRDWPWPVPARADVGSLF